MSGSPFDSQLLRRLDEAGRSPDKAQQIKSLLSEMEGRPDADSAPMLYLKGLALAMLDRRREALEALRPVAEGEGRLAHAARRSIEVIGSEH